MSHCRTRCIRGIRRIRHSPRAWFAALVLLAACSPDRIDGPQEPHELPAKERRVIPPPTLSTITPSNPTMSIVACGDPLVLPLSDLDRSPGTVTITNDAERLYVTYATPTEHWWFSDTRLEIDKSAAFIPRDESGNPEPWSFEYSGVHEPPITAFTYSFRITDLHVQLGETVVIAAMAGTVHPVDENDYDGDWEWMVMWGVGSSDGSPTVVNNYTLSTCGGEPPPPPPATDGGIFSLTFDDGFKTTWTRVFPVLQDLGMRGNVAVNPDPIDGGWSDYMTLGNLQTLWDNGWSIVSHSMSHADMTTLSASELEHEVHDSQIWVQDHGFGPTDMFVVPYHSWGQRERDLIEQYYKRARGYTADQFWPELYQQYPFTHPYDLTAFEPEYAPFTTAEGREMTIDIIQRVIDEGEYVDIFFHRVTEAQLPAFRDLMTQIAQYKDHLRTYAEFTADPPTP